MTEIAEINSGGIDAAARCPVDYRALLGEPAWRRLRPAVRARMAATRAHYRGVMARVELSAVGHLVAWLAVPFGRALVTFTGVNVPMDVQVSPTTDGGSRWRRRYRFDGHGVIEVSSVKRLDAGGMLVECLGGVLRMRLALAERGGALVFESTRYCLRLGALDIVLPAWLSPGRTCVVHRDLGGGAFEFALTIDHPLFGRLTSQVGRFTRLGDES